MTRDRECLLLVWISAEHYDKQGATFNSFVSRCEEGIVFGPVDVVPLWCCVLQSVLRVVAMGRCEGIKHRVVVE